MLRNNDNNKITSILGPEVEINGDVKAVGSILIYGRINGNVMSTGTITTAKNSHIKGDIQSDNAIISGYVDGDLKINNKTTLEKDCTLTGNLTTSIVVVEEGASFEGLCNMLGSNNQEILSNKDDDLDADETY